MTPPAVETQALNFFYGDRQALRDVSFRVERGQVFGLLGPNGGGKTTLFRILSTLLPPASGAARILGLDVVERSIEARRRIGVVFQNQSLDRRLSVEENLACQGRLYGLRGQALRRRIEDALERARLADRRGEIVDKLSGGLRRRAELAKSLLHNPELLLLDEPSTGVDPAVRLDFWAHLQRLRREAGVTILLTTHLLEEADKCDRLAVIDRGAIVAEGTPAELKARIGGDVVSFASSDPETLARALRERGVADLRLIDGAVRFESPNGAESAAALMRELTAPVDSITVSRPSLEDVFIQATGHRFEEASE